MTFESERLFSVAFYIWLPPVSYVVLLTTLVKYYFYLYAPINLDECHAWFHLYGLRQAVMNGEASEKFKMKIYDVYVFCEIRTRNFSHCKLGP